MSELHRNALPVGYDLESYRIDALLGHGGFGITYRATDQDLKQVVAIKEYLPREIATRDRDSTVVPVSGSDQETFEWGLERFLDEARTLAQFQHSNIVAVRRFIRANGTAYLVMDYCAGESLEIVLDREGTLDASRVETLLAPLLDALEALHKVGVTHRDIKPGNIYLREDGSPVLLDFGAARQALAQHSRSVTAMATPGYAAFEQYSTKGKQGPWSDIYGLGATLYRCVTSQRPADASDRMLEDELVPAARAARGRYPENLLQQIDAALALRPQNRPQSVAEWRRIGGIEAELAAEREQYVRQMEIQRSEVQAEKRRQEEAQKRPAETRIGKSGRYLDNGDGTVTDPETGLQWMRCSLGQTWNGVNCAGEAQRYRWDEAIAAASELNQRGGYAGNCDWRVPTIEELNTLVYCSSGDPGGFPFVGKRETSGCKGKYQQPTIDLEAFPNTEPSYFWSGSPGAGFSNYALVVHFSGGSANFSVNRSSSYRVRLVRSVQ